MKKLKVNDLLKSIIGLLIRGVGVGFMIYASLGLNPATVFQAGFTNMIKVSYGFGAVIVNIIILFVVYLIDKKYVNISSLLAIFIIGYAAEFTDLVLKYLLGLNTAMHVQLVILIFGCIILAIGTVVYTNARLGVGALDVFPEMISDKSNYPFKVVRIICDGVFLVFGFMMGGYVGIGTIVSLLVLGPMMQWVRSFNIDIRITNLDYV